MLAAIGNRPEKADSLKKIILKMKSVFEEDELYIPPVVRPNLKKLNDKYTEKNPEKAKE